MAICISHGNDSSGHIKDLTHWAKTNEICDGWTMPAKAKPGDTLLIYMLAPVSALVAYAEVLEIPVPGDDRGWPGKYMAPIGNIQLLTPHITRDELLKNFKGWKWPKSPQSACVVPVEFEKALQKLARERSTSLRDSAKKKSVSKSSGNGNGEPPKDISDIEKALEGMKDEYTSFRTKRSKKLRDAKLSASNGTCECCQKNFKELLGDMGERVLQVHHRQPLCELDEAKLNGLKDLAVVCANCHLLIHANPKKALKIESLAKMLAKSAS